MDDFGYGKDIAPIKAFVSHACNELYDTILEVMQLNFIDEKTRSALEGELLNVEKNF